jgi:uncharacterized protein YecE (DUF72 family)
MASPPLHIGCSGWSYPHWRERFYPPKLPAAKQLEYFATQFPTTEVNATFYRLQKPEAVARWLDVTPPGFIFTLKASRYLTHVRRLRGIDEALDRFYESVAPLVGTDRLGPILWQLPPNLKRDDDLLGEALNALPPGRHAFEFRHPTWFNATTLDMLQAFDASLVIAHSAVRPFGLVLPTASWVYFRLHRGARGRRGNYSDAELREWAARVRAMNADREVFVYFDNDWEAFAPANAKRLTELLA